MPSEIIVIVDAYSTGKHFASTLKDSRYNYIHIKSSKFLSKNFQHREQDFIASFLFDNNLKEIIQNLLKYQIKVVITGSESGVEVSDKISEALNQKNKNIITNGAKLSRTRRNKYDMTEAVRNAGLKTVDHFKSSKVENILNWTQQRNDFPEKPIVLKPLESASSDHVYFCHNVQEIIEAFYKILNSTNLFGQKNTEVLVQSFNSGIEYIVNTVGWEGDHFVAEIWRINKISGTTIYDTAEIISEDAFEFKPIVEYVKRVLNAVGITYAPATTELKFTPEGGPLLIETASRPMRNTQMAFSEKLIGFSQPLLTIEAYIETEKFLKRKKMGRPQMQLRGVAVVLQSNIAGTLKRQIDITEIKKLPTFHCASIFVNQGEKLKKTVDALTAPGEIYLIGNKGTIEQDIKKIREIENNLYRNALKMP